MKEYTSLKLAPYIVVFWHCHYCGINKHETMTAYQFRTIKEVKCDNCGKTLTVSDR